MTTQEIREALALCVQAPTNDFDPCKQCPYYPANGDDEYCICRLMKDATKYIDDMEWYIRYGAKRN